MRLAVGCLLVAIGLAGCAAGPSGAVKDTSAHAPQAAIESPEVQSANSRSLRISPEVNMPKHVKYFAPVAGWLNGDDEYAFAPGDPNLLLIKYLRAHAQDIGQLYLKAFTARIVTDPRFTLVDDPAADQLRLSVIEYGLQNQSTEENTMSALMEVKLELISPSGEVLWAKASGSSHVHAKVKYDAGHYLQDPSKVTATFQAACADMAARLVRSLDVASSRKP